MTAARSRNRVWDMIHAERAALAADLAGLDAEQWNHPTLCGDWNVEQVVAHLSAAASIGRLRWIRSMAGARFDPAVHNARRLAEHRGQTPAQTLARFRAVLTSTTAPSGHTPAWLGEIVVHAHDIRRPLGLTTTTPVDAVTEVARFFASRDFTVAGKTAARGLRLHADDGPFRTGDGPSVHGTTIALVMAMAGRTTYYEELTGPGVPLLLRRDTVHRPQERPS